MGDRGALAGASACRAATKRGGPCRASALPGGDYCAFHEPALAERRRQARAEGARKTNRLRVLEGRRARLDTPAALVAFVGGVVHDVVGGALEPDVARCAICGCSVLRQAIESSDLEKRLAALEAALPAARGQRWA